MALLCNCRLSEIAALVAALLAFRGFYFLQAQTVPNNLNVGVLLNEDSRQAGLHRLALEVALEEINEADLLNGTKLALRFVYAKPNAYHTARAAMYLFKENIVSVLGPEGSTGSQFLAQMAEEVHVPLVSFATTDSSLSESQNPYFTRVIFNDAEQMASIAAIIRYYSWSDVIFFSTDNDNGHYAAQALYNELERLGIEIVYKALFSQKENETMFVQELRKVLNIQSSVVIVHMPAELGHTLLSSASSLGMFNSGYVWIVTNDIVHFLDVFSMSPEDNLRKFQGIIGIRSYLPSSVKLKNFKSEMKTRIETANFEDELINSYTPFAYDALWIVAYAVSTFLNKSTTFSFGNVSLFSGSIQLPVFKEGHNLMDCILKSKFLGMTGTIQFDSRGDRQHPSFEVVNFVGKGMRTVGYWSKTVGFSTIPLSTFSEVPLKTNSRFDHLSDVIWPGGMAAVPSGWVDTKQNQMLRIAVPQKAGYKTFVSAKKDGSGKYYFDGFCIDIFESAIKRLPYDVMYDFILYGNGSSNPDYDELVDKVAHKEFDAAVGDITITEKRKLDALFTQPFMSSGLAMLVKEREFLPNQALSFMTPFSMGLWLMIFVFVLYTGFVVCILEHRKNEEFGGDATTKAAKTLWFMVSTLFATQNERVISALGRCVLIVWLFFVLIIIQSYTAYLTSVLTVENLGPTIDEVSQLLQSDLPIGYQSGSFVNGYLQNLGVKKERLFPLNGASSYAKALESGPDGGGVAAIVDELPYLDLFLSATCDFELVGEAFRTTGWGFVFPNGSTLADDFTMAILSLSETNDLQRIYSKWLKQPQCDRSRPASTKLDIGAFWGLLSLSGLVCTLAVICFTAIQIHQFNKIADNSRISLVSRFKKFMVFISQTEQTNHASESK